MIYETIRQLAKELGNLDRCLDKGLAHAEALKFDPTVLLNARLAPDQYPLVRQIQAACDSAKFAAARLSGRQPPVHPDTESTLPEIKARLAAVQDYLGSFSAADFEGGAERTIGINWMPGKGLLGAAYLNELSVPNFYFHLATAYSILRHNGVPVGKVDFIGSLPFFDI